MRVILIDNLIYEDSGKYDLQPHLGLLSLAAVARQIGHEAEIYDPKLNLVSGQLTLDASVYRRMARQILKREPNVVGFTALGCNFHCVTKVAAQIRCLRPEVPMLLGGPHATILHREILERFPMFDVVVRNEAEQTLPPLLQRLYDMDFVDLPGISYRNNQGEVVCNAGSPMVEDLDLLPIPAYDLYPLSNLRLSTIRVEAGRGCPFSCTFCSTASFFGRNYRLKSVARLLAEMDYLHTKYGYTDFKLNHDLFTVNRNKVMGFCEAMLTRQYTWGCSARVDCVDRELLTMMYRAGCRNIYFGIETGSERIQSTSRKNLDLRLVEPIIEVTADLGVRTTASFITGYPEETIEDQQATLDLAGRLFCRRDGLTVSQVHLLTPEPGTQLMKSYGDRLCFDGHISDFNFPHLEPDDSRLVAENPAIFGNHHYFPTALSRNRHIFVTLAWKVLWVTGRTILRYLLRPFDGRLSRFIDEAYNWHESTRPEIRDIDVTDVTAFVAARFGNCHHLVSLFRYADAVNKILLAPQQQTINKSSTGMVHPSVATLAMRASAIVLRDIHDCLELLRHIESDDGNGLMADSFVGPTGHLLLVRESPRTSIASSPAIATFAIDGPTADLLNRFSEPTTYWDCCRQIAENDSNAPLPDWTDVEQLCAMGVLEVRGRRKSTIAVNLMLCP